MVLTFIKLNFKHFLLYKMSLGSTLISRYKGSGTPVFLISGLSTCHQVYIFTPEEGNDNPLQFSCLENSIDRGAWWATVYGVAESRTQLELTREQDILQFLTHPATLANCEGCI